MDMTNYYFKQRQTVKSYLKELRPSLTKMYRDPTPVFDSNPIYHLGEVMIR